MITRGFGGRRPPTDTENRLPPGQSLTHDFPVLSAGPTPRVAIEDWSFALKHGPRPIKRWTWTEFGQLPRTKMTRDIHCVTAWSKFDTPWQGVLIDDILADAGLAPPTAFTLAHSHDGYSTNVPVADLVGGKAMIATHYEGKPLTRRPRRSGTPSGPASLFLEIGQMDQRAAVHRDRHRRLLELHGYHNYGDPWLEQRYTDD